MLWLTVDRATGSKQTVEVWKSLPNAAEQAEETSPLTLACSSANDSTALSHLHGTDAQTTSSRGGRARWIAPLSDHCSSSSAFQHTIKQPAKPSCSQNNKQSPTQRTLSLQTCRTLNVLHTDHMFCHVRLWMCLFHRLEFDLLTAQT